jgi:hypothetical protein
MSKILRRPMFRGGRVDSRGTGITSGLMDKPKRGLVDEPGGYAGEVRTGGDLLKNVNTRFDPFYQNMNMDQLRAFQSLGMGNPFRSIKDMPGRFKNAFTFQEPARGDSLVDKIISSAPIVQEQEKFEEDVDKNRQILDNKQFFSGDVDEVIKQNKKQKSDINNLNQFELNNPNSNQEQATEIDAKQLMKENAELFKELLGESNKKKLKDARISDASDYLLKFFEGTQREGATVGSAAADVAAFATARDSRTERAKAGIEKQDQTAMALAINDYIAGKRSKEQLDMLSKKLDINLKNKLDAIDYTAAVATAAEKGKSMSKLVSESKEGTPTKKIQEAATLYADNQGLNIPETITSEEIKGDDTTPLVTDTETLLVEENKNQIFIDKATRQVFQVVEDPNNPGKFLKKRLY